jgi:capsular exopolysaccharide synthesis family protein
VPSEEKIKPKRSLIVILVAVASTFIGILVAFAREAADTTIRSREQAERQAGIVVLTSIPPPLARQKKRWRRAQAQRGEPHQLLPLFADASQSEALRYLHARIRHRNSDRQIQTLLCASPGSEPSSATTLVNLALVAASTGEKTLLVDSNLRHPELHQLLQCSPTPGLVDILTDPESWQKGIHATNLENLHLIPAGSITPRAPMALESAAFNVLLDHFRTTYDFILFAAPSICTYTDAAVLSAKLDATCLILTYGTSRIEAVVEAKATLEAVHGNVIGSALTSQEG